ncbi:MAG TPA: TIM barrel protein [Nevskiaceae bacterium]|nr:TIM barrel protein [Nevskiaceae bacterium]
MPRFSANLGFLWPDRPLLDRIEAAADAGFRAIELHFPYDTPAADVRGACERRNLTLLGINTAPGDRARGEFGLGALAGREADFQAAVDQSIAWCVESGAQAIHCLAGNVAPDDRAEARVVLERNLREAAAKAARHGLVLLLEPLNPHDNPGYFYSHVAEVAAILEHLRLDAVRLQFDCYHVGRVGDDVLAELHRHRLLIGNVQVAAVPTRAEPDQGTLAYGPIFEALDGLGYDGWVGCEYKPRAGTDEGLGWMRALAPSGIVGLADE